MNKIKILIFLMITILFIFSLTGCSNDEPVIQETVVAVETLKLEPTILSNTVKFAGEVASSDEVLISTKIPGKIGGMYVEIGDQIRTGELLFELENQDLKAAVEQAEQSLAIAQANLAQIQNGARPQEIEQANQMVNQAQVQLETAQANLERMQELYDGEAISKQQYDQALSQLQLAEASYKSALEQQSLIEEGASKDTIRAAEAQVGLAKANLKMAQAKLKDTMIDSPIDGRIGFVKFDPGEFVLQGNPVVSVLNDQEMIVNIDISEAHIGKIKLNNKVQVSIPATSNQPYEGAVTRISPAADSKSKVYPIEITINNSNSEIKPGMSANVLLALEKKENIISVPVDATFEELGNYYVYKVENSKAVKTKIITGVNDGIRVEVIEGLTEGDYVIIKGQNRVSNGDSVREGGRSQ